MDPRGSGQMSDNYDFYVQEENQDSCDSWEERSSGRTRALAGKSTCYPKQVQENRFSPPWAAVSAPRDRHAGLYSPDCTVTYTAPSRSPVNTNSSSAFGSDKSNMGGNDNVSCFYRKNKLGMHSRDRSPIFPSQEDGEVNDIVQSGKSKRYLEDDCYGDSLFRPPLWTDSRDPMRDLPHSSLSSRPQQFRNSPIDRSEMGLHSQDEDSIGRRDYGRRDDTPERRSSPRTQEWSTRRGDLLKRSGSPRNQDWPKRRDNRPDTQDWPIARDYRLERSGSPRTQDWCVRRDDRPERSSSPRTQDWCARRDDKLERSGSPRTQDWSIRRDDRPERSGSPRTQDWSNRRKDRLKRSGSPRTQDWPKRRDDRPERNISPRTPNWSNRKTDNMEGNSSCRNQDWSERSGDRNREDWLEQIETDESDIRDRYNWQKEEWFNRRDDSSDKVDKWSFTRHQHFERTRSRDQLSERRDHDNFDLFERRNYLAHDWQDRHEPDTSSRSERKEDRRETFDKTGNRFNRRDSDSFESSHYSRTGQLEGSESVNSSLRRSYGTLSFDVEKEMFPPERMSSGNNYPPNNSAKNVTYSPIPSPPPPPVLSMSPLHGNQTTDYSKPLPFKSSVVLDDSDNVKQSVRLLENLKKKQEILSKCQLKIGELYKKKIVLTDTPSVFLAFAQRKLELGNDCSPVAFVQNLSLSINGSALSKRTYLQPPVKEGCESTGGTKALVAPVANDISLDETGYDRMRTSTAFIKTLSSDFKLSSTDNLQNTSTFTKDYPPPNLSCYQNPYVESYNLTGDYSKDQQPCSKYSFNTIHDSTIGSSKDMSRFELPVSKIFDSLVQNPLHTNLVPSNRGSGWPNVPRENAPPKQTFNSINSVQQVSSVPQLSAPSLAPLNYTRTNSHTNQITLNLLPRENTTKVSGKEDSEYVNKVEMFLAKIQGVHSPTHTKNARREGHSQGAPKIPNDEDDDVIFVGETSLSSCSTSNVKDCYPPSSKSERRNVGHDLTDWKSSKRHGSNNFSSPPKLEPPPNNIPLQTSRYEERQVVNNIPFGRTSMPLVLPKLTASQSSNLTLVVGKKDNSAKQNNFKLTVGIMQGNLSTLNTSKPNLIVVESSLNKESPVQSCSPSNAGPSNNKQNISSNLKEIHPSELKPPGDNDFQLFDVNKTVSKMEKSVKNTYSSVSRQWIDNKIDEDDTQLYSVTELKVNRLKEWEKSNSPSNEDKSHEPDQVTVETDSGCPSTGADQISIDKRITPGISSDYEPPESNKPARDSHANVLTCFENIFKEGSEIAKDIRDIQRSDLRLTKVINNSIRNRTINKNLCVLNELLCLKNEKFGARIIASTVEEHIIHFLHCLNGHCNDSLPKTLKKYFTPIKELPEKIKSAMNLCDQCQKRPSPVSADKKIKLYQSSDKDYSIKGKSNSETNLSVSSHGTSVDNSGEKFGQKKKSKKSSLNTSESTKMIVSKSQKDLTEDVIKSKKSGNSVMVKSSSLYCKSSQKKESLKSVMKDANRYSTDESLSTCSNVKQSPKSSSPVQFCGESNTVSEKLSATGGKVKDPINSVKNIQSTSVNVKTIISKLCQGENKSIYFVKNNLLLKKCNLNGKALLRIYIPEDKIKEIVQIAHTEFSSHGNLNSVVNILKKHFSPIPSLDILRKIVETCPDCSTDSLN